MATTTEVDRIEREIEIAAPAERVWAFVSQPGWFIYESKSDGLQVDHDADLAVVHHPEHGRFLFRTLTLDEPAYAAFRWYIEPDPAASSTLVEFWITPSDTGVTLKVVESGFASLDEPEVNRRSRFDDHNEGWRQELGLARDHVMSGTAHA
ncbi:hypothetical protein GOARA_012_00680 [Gordonia araii NBRC 100433]|uniref:Activator of Hsp90 ATPase homologue 1/2-like C-terminal domain-containing protein n=1 Tax=Gordonia araii NBRC 100433 TaxID=1073574 RepID=G7GY43_9ACTN|nr:SRPBCC domain-containing protein [Gordonia araii]NNG98129.1 ATPase [Gordonia araii NBRC 100433]GAB08518.1 hypothetical protein GOARA_012_00680 [Gordonia araii NBRC 100433]